MLSLPDARKCCHTADTSQWRRCKIEGYQNQYVCNRHQYAAVPAERPTDLTSLSDLAARMQETSAAGGREAPQEAAEAASRLEPPEAASRLEPPEAALPQTTEAATSLEAQVINLSTLLVAAQATNIGHLEHVRSLETEVHTLHALVAEKTAAIDSLKAQLSKLEHVSSRELS
ncbi:hypothetical protein ABBQ32_010171 [Trebouxia sp. C0010 RCD-2024]